MGKIIDKDISIEELVELVPASVSYLAKMGIKCIACGEPIWGSLEEAASEKGFGKEEIDGFAKENADLERENKGLADDVKKLEAKNGKLREDIEKLHRLKEEYMRSIAKFKELREELIP